MKSFFIALATTVLVQAVDISKVIEMETDQSANWLDSQNNFAQVGGRGRGNSFSGGSRPKPTNTSTLNRPRATSDPSALNPSRPTTTTSNRPASTTVSRPSARPSISNRPSANSIPSRPSRNDGLRVPSNSAANGRNRATSTAIFGRPSRAERVSVATTVRSRSLESDSRVSRSMDSNPPAAVTQNQWSAADKLVVGTTILQLPAMVAQTTVEAINAQNQLEESRDQFNKNYNLAVEQNNQDKAARIKAEQDAAEQAAKDAKAAEIAAIWRAQQAVADDWADAKERADVLYQELTDNYQAQDDLAARCSNPNTQGCENAFAEQLALQAEEQRINDDFDALDQEMLDLVDVQDQLAQMEEDFCNDDPGEFATDCLAL